MFEQLMKAITEGNPTVAEEIVEKIDQGTINSNESAQWLLALSKAAAQDQSVVFHKLFAKVNQQVVGVKDENNKTVLHIAAEKGYDKIVNQVINMNLKLINAVDNQGKTALHYHGKGGNTNLETVNILLNKMSTKAIDSIDKENKTALHYMMQYTQNKSENIKEIIEIVTSKTSHDTVNVVANDKSTALNHLLNNENIKEDEKNELIKFFIVKMNQQAIDGIVKYFNNDIESMKLKIPNYVSYNSHIKSGYNESNWCWDRQILYNCRKVEELEKNMNKLINKVTTCCSELITENPNDAELYLKKSNILFGIDQKEEGKKCYDKAQKLKTEGGHIATTVSQAKVVDVEFEEADGKKQDYSASKITKLIKKQLKDDSISITSADVERGKLPASEIEAILRVVKEEGKIIVPLRIKDDAWAGIVITKDGEHGLKIIYHDPSGEGYTKTKNVKSLINTLMNSSTKVEKIDLHYKQEGSSSDSSALVVDNLTVLAKKQITDLNLPAIEALLTPERINISQIKMKHSLIMDNNQWYSEFKLLKLLEINPKNENITIASFDLENKEKISSKIEELISNITTGQKSAAAVPLHLHGKDWASLVIKQNFEEETADGLKIIYNDSRGISLNQETEVKKFIAKICKIIGEIKVFDLQEKQHEDENDSAVYAVENLSILSTKDTNDLNKSGLKDLMKNGFLDEESKVKDVGVLRNEHIKLLSDEIGIDIGQYTALAGDHSNSSSHD